MADVDVNTLTTADAGVAKVTVTIPGFSVVAQGTSKRHPNDIPLPTVGESLALARALKEAGEKLEAYANSRVAHWNG